MSTLIFLVINIKGSAKRDAVIHPHSDKPRDEKSEQEYLREKGNASCGDRFMLAAKSNVYGVVKHICSKTGLVNLKMFKSRSEKVRFSSRKSPISVL
jgi:hypothetical protein